METRRITDEELAVITSLKEDHFNDFKSRQITPAKLQECFVAFANSDGGDLYIGIEDDKSTRDRVIGFTEPEDANGVIHTLLEETDPSVENVEIIFLKTEKNGLVLHINIPKSPKVHYTASGDCHVRINAQKKKIKGERITALAYSKGAEPYEKKPVDIVDIDDIIGSDAFIDYLTRVNSKIDPTTFLKKQRLLTKKDKELIPNVGCVLLFDDQAQASLDTRCSVKVHRLRTTEVEYKREHLMEMPVTITGTIELVISNTIKKVKEYIDGASIQDGGKMVKLSYPPEALKEILVNAVIHRDYSLNDDIHVKIYDNRVEVTSPGRLPGYMTVKNIYEDRFSRNPNIVRMLHNLPNPVNHDIGEGLDTAKNELKKAGLVEPEFAEKENQFVVIIKHKRIDSVIDVIVKYFEENPKAQITNKLIRRLSGEDDMQKVKKALVKLRTEGVIKLYDENVSRFNFSYILNEEKNKKTKK